MLSDVYVSIGNRTTVFFCPRANSYLLAETPTCEELELEPEAVGARLELWCTAVANAQLGRTDLQIVIADNRDDERIAGSAMVLWRERAERYFATRQDARWLGPILHIQLFFALRRIAECVATGRMHELLSYAHPAVSTRRRFDPAHFADAVLKASILHSVLFSRRIECLAASAIIVRMLRSHGWHAELRIGVCHTPFEAHAWCELDGRVLGDFEETPGQTNVIFAWSTKSK